MVVLLITASLEGQHLAKSFFNTGLLGAAGGGVELPSDDQFNRVSFLSHFDGANNGVNNVFDDGSANNYTVTAAGNVTQGSFGPFAKPDGEWGVSFDSSDVAPISAADSADWDFASGNFTVEAFVFPTKLGTYQPIIVHWGDFSGSNIAWSLNLSNNDKWSFLFKIGSTIYEAGVGDAVVAAGLNQWYHLAAVRNGNDFTVYVNGTAYGTVITNAGTINNCTDVLRIGAYHATYTWTGNISNARIVKGTAVYTGNFTAPTSKLTAVTNTKLLTCQSNRFVDNSASAHTLTSSGKTAISAFGPFLTSNVYDAAVNGASAYFDGDGDYLSFPDSADWDFGTGDFTVEGWVNPASDLASDTQFIGFGDGDNGGNFGFEATGKPYFYHGGYYARTNTALKLGSWSYIAFVRSSGTLSCYINGTSAASSSYTGNVGGSLAPRVGAYSGGQYFKGYMQDVRILKGTAVYTSNFTPPTAPLTAITNTKLLLNMADAQAIDSAAQSNLTLYGNANTSTDQAKFGDTSLHLDGTGDYFEVPNPTSLAFGTGNFTLECWVYMAVDNTNKAIVETRASDLSANGFVFAIDASGGRKLMVYSNAKLFTTSNAISLNTWTHIAISRSGTTLKCFINGTQGASVTNSQDYTNTLVRVGRGIYASSDFNGYIDDLRFSNMARYTSNFTAPTEPFADKGQ